MKIKIAAILLACIIGPSWNCLAATPVFPGIQSLKTLEALDRTASLDLEINGGNSAKQKLRAVKIMYPKYQLVSGCVGSFKIDGAHDVGVALINPTAKTGVYAVGLSGSKGDSILEVAKFPIEFNQQGQIPKPLEVRCHSRTELLRIVKEYSAPRPETPAASAAIKPISYFDAICITPFAQPEDFICYGYSDATRGFVKIGSWFND